MWFVLENLSVMDPKYEYGPLVPQLLALRAKPYRQQGTRQIGISAGLPLLHDTRRRRRLPEPNFFLALFLC